MRLWVRPGVQLRDGRTYLFWLLAQTVQNLSLKLPSSVWFACAALDELWAPLAWSIAGDQEDQLGIGVYDTVLLDVACQQPGENKNVQVTVMI
jgi:hypothetical protein